MATVSITSLDSFAEKLGLPKTVLMAHVFCAERHYKQFRVRKRSGRGYRRLCAPSQRLKGIQRWILCFILRQVTVHSASTAFRPGCSIVNNASSHVGRPFVFNTDIEDFFPSITIARVIGLFKSLGYSPDVAWALGRLTTYKGILPQGAPSSPEIANLICRKLDRRMSAFCKERGWVYTRYCDDITVSGCRGVNEEREKIINIIKDEGFKLNVKKTRTIRRGGRQIVTGLVVNRVVNAPRTDRKSIRAMFHQARLNPVRFYARYSELEGALAYLHMINPDDSHLEQYANVLKVLRDSAGN